jgi:hypothetical protein
MCSSRAPLRRHRRARQRDRILDLPALALHHRQKIQRVSIARLRLQDLPIQSLRLLQTSFPVVPDRLLKRGVDIHDEGTRIAI